MFSWNFFLIPIVLFNICTKTILMHQNNRILTTSNNRIRLTLR